MSDARHPDRHRPWYRELWPWLLMLPPAASIAGGVTMVILASSTPNALVVEDYARIEALTSERFDRDRRALALGLEAELEFIATPARVELRLRSAAGEALPRSVRLVLRHATNPDADKDLALLDAGGGYAAPLELSPGRYRAELLPPDLSWRLGGELAGLDGRYTLSPQPDGGVESVRAGGPAAAGQARDPGR